MACINCVPHKLGMIIRVSIENFHDLQPLRQEQSTAWEMLDSRKELNIKFLEGIARIMDQTCKLCAENPHTGKCLCSLCRGVNNNAV